MALNTNLYYFNFNYFLKSKAAWICLLLCIVIVMPCSRAGAINTVSNIMRNKLSSTRSHRLSQLLSVTTPLLAGDGNYNGKVSKLKVANKIILNNYSYNGNSSENLIYSYQHRNKSSAQLLSRSSSTVFNVSSTIISSSSNLTVDRENDRAKLINWTLLNSCGNGTWCRLAHTVQQGKSRRLLKQGFKVRTRRDLLQLRDENAETASKKDKRHTRSVKKYSGKKKILTILGLFELTQNNSRRESGESERAAAQLALDDINGNESILPGYHIMMHTNDTQCDPGTGVDAFFHALYKRKDKKIISLLGTACSEVTERLAKVTTHQRIVQVSFGSTSPSLSDRKEFPLFYRTVAPVSSHAEAIIELIKHFKWDTVSFFTKNENRYTMPVNYLVKELEEKGNITCKATLTFSLSDFRYQLKEMKDLDARIIIANFGTDVAPFIFCEVWKLGIWGRDYAWILFGKPEILWWRDRSIFRQSGEEGGPLSLFENLECSQKQLNEAIENALIVDRYNMLERPSDFGLTTETFSRRLKGEASSSSAVVMSQYAPESYDAVWSVALGLRQLREKYNYSLEHFDYMDDAFSYALNIEIGLLKFTGISGPIRFLGSDRIGLTSFMQIQKGIIVSVGLLHPDKPTNKLELSTCFNCRSIQWAGNQVPISKREFRINLIRVDNSPYIIIACAAVLGILMAAFFLAFNLYYRKLKYIKLSSPRLNNMVIIGCIFAYIAVILLGSDFDPVAQSDGKRFSYVCTIRAYLLSMGFSLAFGSMFAKTYRVHRIFTRSCIGVVKNKLLKDTQLMTLIMALLLIDVIIVTSWASFDPMHRHLNNLTLEKDPTDRSVVYQNQIEVCQSQHGNVWLSIMYGYKSLLLVVGIYMAWETRHVKIQALNDSKNIAYCVYIVVLTSILAVSLANLISERVTLSFVTVTSLILISTTVTLCLLFLPKIHTIKTGGHKGDPVVESMGLKIEFNTRRLVVEDAKELLFRAEVQNRVYKRQIEAIDVEIWRLENLLLCSSHSSLSSIGKKQEQDMKTSPGKRPSSPRGSSSDETTSEIYTVYLHGPRFIVPISVLSFQNPNALPPTCTGAGDYGGTSGTSLAGGLPGTSSSNTLLNPSTLSPSAAPRSSWPNMRSLLAPSNGLIAKKYKFKSEPKLLIEEVESDSNNCSSGGQQHHHHHHQEPLPSLPFSTQGISDESLVLLSKSSKAAKNSRRKSSNTSCGAGTSSGGSKRSSIFSVLKSPFNYFSGVIRSSISPTNTESNANASQLELDENLDNPSPSEGPIHLLTVPRDPGRHKYSSVPDLWAVRGSPVLQHNRKKSSILSDSVVDTSTLFYSSDYEIPTRPVKSSSNPVLKLTVTSDESPYL